MYNCKKCLENVWSFNFIDGWIEATCKICGNVISFESKKTKYKRINNQLPKAKFPVLYIDGGCTLPGQLDPLKREIISVVTNEKGTVVSEYNGKVVGGGSANIAEFNALFNALFFIKTKNMSKEQLEEELETLKTELKSMEEDRDNYRERFDALEALVEDFYSSYRKV